MNQQTRNHLRVESINLYGQVPKLSLEQGSFSRPTLYHKLGAGNATSRSKCGGFEPNLSLKKTDNSPWQVQSKRLKIKVQSERNKNNQEKNFNYQNEVEKLTHICQQFFEQNRKLKQEIRNYQMKNPIGIRKAQESQSQILRKQREILQIKVDQLNQELFLKDKTIYNIQESLRQKQKRIQNLLSIQMNAKQQVEENKKLSDKLNKKEEQVKWLNEIVKQLKERIQTFQGKMFSDNQTQTQSEKNKEQSQFKDSFKQIGIQLDLFEEEQSASMRQLKEQNTILLKNLQKIKQDHTKMYEQIKYFSTKSQTLKNRLQISEERLTKIMNNYTNLLSEVQKSAEQSSELQSQIEKHLEKKLQSIKDSMNSQMLESERKHKQKLYSNSSETCEQENTLSNDQKEVNQFKLKEKSTTEETE